MTNKETFIKWVKIVLFALFIMTTIITCSGVWNAVALKAIDSFYAWVAGVEFVGLGYCFYKVGKRLFKE